MHRCIVCALVLFIGAARAAIDHTAIKADTRRLIHFSESFGFSLHGILELQLRDLKIYKERSSKTAPAGDINYDRFGFFIAPADADIKLEQEDLPKHCSLDDPYVKTLFRFSDSDVQKLLKNASAHVMNRNFTFPKGGELKLHFANCESDTPVSFKARIAMYNVDRHGRRVYLSVGQTELTVVYWVRTLSVLFALVAPHTDGSHPHACSGCLPCLLAARSRGPGSCTSPGTRRTRSTS
jgi:G protein-coupled receptor 107